MTDEFTIEHSHPIKPSLNGITSGKGVTTRPRIGPYDHSDSLPKRLAVITEIQEQASLNEEPSFGHLYPQQKNKSK